RYSLGGITHGFSHLGRQVQTVLGLQDISHTALAGLAVDTDNICVIISSQVCRINGKIWHSPMIRLFLLQPVHTFCNGILVRTGECSKYQSAAVWTSLVDLHAGKFFIFLTDLCHVAEVQIRFHPLRIHIQSQGNNIYVSCSLTVSKKGSLNPVSSCQKSHLR